MTAPTRLKWGILSTSTVAVGKAIPALKRCAEVEVVAIASRDLNRALHFASSFDIRKAYGSYEALLQDETVGAVYVPLPNSLHAEWTERAARAGKHVLCEKPATTSPEVAQKMIATCRENNVLFMEGFMYRFHPQFDRVNEWLKENRIGPMCQIRVLFSFTLEARHSRARLRASLAGGALADVGSYGIDLSRWLIGTEPSRVFASGTRGQDADVETSFAAILSYADGTEVLLDGGFDRPRQNRCEIVGRSGIITIESPFIPMDRAAVRLQTAKGEEHQVFPFVDPFELQFEHFTACVLNQTAPAITAAETIGNASTLAALRASLESRCAVNLALGTGQDRSDCAHRLEDA